jgi:hypothetical protein
MGVHTHHPHQAWANFSIMTKWTPKSGRCHSVWILWLSLTKAVDKLCPFSALSVKIEKIRPWIYPADYFFSRPQGVTKKCRLSLLTNSALVIRVQMRGEGGSCGVSANEYSCTHHVTWSPNKLWRAMTDKFTKLWAFAAVSTSYSTSRVANN